MGCVSAEPQETNGCPCSVLNTSVASLPLARQAWHCIGLRQQSKMLNDLVAPEDGGSRCKQSPSLCRPQGHTTRPPHGAEKDGRRPTPTWRQRSVCVWTWQAPAPCGPLNSSWAPSDWLVCCSSSHTSTRPDGTSGFAGLSSGSKSAILSDSGRRAGAGAVARDGGTLRRRWAPNGLPD